MLDNNFFFNPVDSIIADEIMTALITREAKIENLCFKEDLTFHFSLGK